MSLFNAQNLTDGYFDYSSWEFVPPAIQYLSSSLESGSSSTIIYYMRGKDVDCGILTYRYWQSENSPDQTGILYTGTKCGISPLSDITIMSIKIINN
jgi:hypothetical protein